MQFPPPEDRKTYPKQCDLCLGDISEQAVTLPLPDRDGGLRVIRGVPAGVCDQCNEKYFTAETALEIDRLLIEPPSREEIVAVWQFGEAS